MAEHKYVIDCPHCSEEVRAAAAFCSECGRSMHDEEREPLTNIPPILLGGWPAPYRVNLKGQQLRTMLWPDGIDDTVEARLSDAGLPVDQDEANSSSVYTVLEIGGDGFSTDDGQYVYRLDVKLEEDMRSLRNATSLIRATIWQEFALNLCTPKTARAKVRADILKLTDQFIEAYHEANNEEDSANEDDE